jgi:hypothetical protein
MNDLEGLIQIIQLGAKFVSPIKIFQNIPKLKIKNESIDHEI